MGLVPDQYFIPTPILRRLLVVATALIISVIAVGTWLLSNGAADPPQHDQLIWEDTITAWLNTDSTTSVVQAPHDLPRTGFTLDIEATLSFTNGPLSRWGVWFNGPDEHYILIGINGSQYVTARVCPSLDPTLLDMCQPLTEPSQHILTYWKFFHHINPLDNANHMRIYVAADDPTLMSLWLNNEWMWDLPVPERPFQSWGVWASLPVAELDWQQVRLWSSSRGG